MRFMAFILGLFLALAVWAGDAFIPGTEDVPLAEGLEIIAGDEDVSFDTPAGQILVVQAQADTLAFGDVMSFYQKTLPALGWRLVDAGVFTRESETLRLSMVRKKPLVVRFELAPSDL